MFYQTGIDITNDKQMFNFLKEHFEYPTMSSWNRLYSIANNVKLYKLRLSGSWTTALSLLETGGYDEIRCMVADWEYEHRDVEVYFNGRSGGYLILKGTDSNDNILPESVTSFDNYEDYKEWCRENFGSVKANRDELVYYTTLVRDFDKLCDEIREYVDELSKMKFEVIEMEKAVYEFNDLYTDDLDLLGFQPLECNEEGIVDISEIKTLTCLIQAFFRVADRKKLGYSLIFVSDDKLQYVAKC